MIKELKNEVVTIETCDEVEAGSLARRYQRTGNYYIADSSEQSDCIYAVHLLKDGKKGELVARIK